jgi:transcriptional regulator with XRE-family HTH domain
MSYDEMKFADKVERLRERDGDSLRTLARIVGAKSPSTVERWFKEGYEPKLAQLLALARHYNVPVEWLIDPEAEWPPPVGGSEAERDAWKAFSMIGERVGWEEVYRRLIGIADVKMEKPLAREVSKTTPTIRGAGSVDMNPRGENSGELEGQDVPERGHS